MNQIALPPTLRDQPPKASTEGGRQILDLLLKSGGMSQADVTRTLSGRMKQPTVARLMQSLQQEDIVRVANRRADRPGNPSVHVTLNPDHAYAFGIEMGEVVSMVLMDLSGNVRSARSLAMPGSTRQQIIDKLKRFKKDLLASVSGSAQVVGVGVGVSGFFVGQGRQVSPPSHLANWGHIDIEPILEDSLQLPVFLDNNATTAAISESLFGVGRTCSNFAYMYVSEGFGGGLIVDGKPMRGHHGNAGKFGGAWIQTGERYADLTLLQACLAARGHFFGSVEDLIKTVDISWDGVHDWIDAAVGPFSRLAGLIAALIDPEKIVLGGRLPPSIATELVSRIRIPATTGRVDTPPPLPTIVNAQVAQHPVAIGAAAMPLQHVFFA